MAKLGTHQIREVALKLLAQNPSGLAKQVLIDQIRQSYPETDPGTISTHINKLAERGLVGRPSHGFYVLAEGSSFAHPAANQSSKVPKISTQTAGTSSAQFEELALVAMSRHLGVKFVKAFAGQLIKKFDFISEDGSVVGDAKFYTLVGRSGHPSAKFATIAEHVWLLEKTNAARKFLVFGNQREVPVKWLARYGRLVDGVEFYFLDDSGGLERLL